MEGSQVLSYTGLLILRLQIEKGVKWHIVESGHHRLTDNHLLLAKTEYLKLCVCVLPASTQLIYDRNF